VRIRFEDIRYIVWPHGHAVRHLRIWNAAPCRPYPARSRELPLACSARPWTKQHVPSSDTAAGYPVLRRASIRLPPTGQHLWGEPNSRRGTEQGIPAAVLNTTTYETSLNINICVGSMTTLQYTTWLVTPTKRHKEVLGSNNTITSHMFNIIFC